MSGDNPFLTPFEAKKLMGYLHGATGEAPAEYKVGSHVIERPQMCIRGDGGGIVPFVYNREQQAFWRCTSQNVVRVKPRKIGSSIYEEQYCLCRCMWCPGQMIMLVFQDPDAQRLHIERLELLYDSCPAALRTRKTGEGSIWEFPDTRSTLILEHARRKLARSVHLTRLVCSEYAFWYEERGCSSAEKARLQRETLLALRGSMLPDAEVVIECTGNGRADNFYRIARAAYDGKGPYTLQFHKADDFYSAEEQAQLRDLVLAEGSTLEDFRQEYPNTFDDAFKASGAYYFEPELIRRLEEEVRPGRRGFLERDGDEAHFIPGGDKDPLQVWDEPDPDDQYAIGCDVASGIATGSDPDYSCASVESRKTGKQVAEWHGLIRPVEFAYVVWDLATWYNGAFVTPERNGPGESMIAELYETLGYTNVYTERVELKTSGKSTNRLGIQTVGGRGERSKGAMYGRYRRDIQQWLNVGTGYGHGVRSPELLAEMRNLRYDGAKIEAGPGAHDDRIDARVFAREGSRSLGPPPARQVSLPEMGRMERARAYLRRLAHPAPPKRSLV